MKLRKILGLIGVLLLATMPTEARGLDHDIRINIFKEIPKASIKGNDLEITDAQTGKMLLRYSGLKEVDIAWVDLGMSVDGKETNAEKIILRANPPFFRIKNKTLQGDLEVIRLNRAGLNLVNKIDLERYLVGLINHEISSSWPMEMLKTQAVVARTYALYRKEKGKYVDYDLESTVSDQVYGGVDKEDSRSALAVRATHGEVLTYDGEIISAFYHACCGGHTEFPQHVWGGNYDGISDVECTFCEASPSYYWNQEFPEKEFVSFLNRAGFPIRHISQVRVLGSTPHGRVLVMGIVGKDDDGRALGEIKLSGNQFRSVLGFGKIRSTLFKVYLVKKDGQLFVKFTGSGSGHGVGMCQWGGRGMAEAGYNYKKILKHYYPEADLKRVYR